MNFVLFSLLFLFLFSCGAPKIDPLSMPMLQQDTEQVVIPTICKPQYVSKVRTVAVVRFANNTTYGKMSATNTQASGTRHTKYKSASAGVAGIVATPGAVGVGYAGVHASDTKVKWSTNINTFYRQISSFLGEYAQSAVENVIANLGGAELYTRARMQEIMQEQNFQMNVADPNTLVKLGKIAGVEYIITGSVDNINAKYIPPDNSKTQKTGNAWLDIALMAGKAAANSQAGWVVTTELTVQIIDVATGRIIFSKKTEGREIASKLPGFNPELIVTAAKKAIGESIDDIKPTTSDIFDVKAYINQLRGGKKVAMIGMGKNKKLEPGQEIEAYEFLEIQDFMSKEKSCTKAKIPVKMIVSNQIDERTAWVTIEGEPSAVARVKVGTLVRRAPLHGQSVFKKMF
jgi:PBP1b-binding outer membrane lipoprotein LpoB